MKEICVVWLKNFFYFVVVEKILNIAYVIKNFNVSTLHTLKAYPC